MPLVIKKTLSLFLNKSENDDNHYSSKLYYIIVPSRHF